jgi:hypothetical protein
VKWSTLTISSIQGVVDDRVRVDSSKSCDFDRIENKPRVSRVTTNIISRRRIGLDIFHKGRFRNG